MSIQIFADQMRNKEICKQILTLLEKNWDSFIDTSNTVILKHIKEMGDFKNQKLPSDKTLKGWIQDYINKSDKAQK